MNADPVRDPGLNPSAARPLAAPDVLVVMAVYRPEAAHLQAQLQSLAEQQGCRLRLIAVIADTVSGALVREQATALGLDLRLVPCDQELDAVRAFETGLIEALAQIEEIGGGGDGAEPAIALCDQDDIWHGDRLEQGLAALRDSGAQMVHSDARLVAEDGQTLLQPSMFAFERRWRRPGLRGLLYRNNITGMTLLMRAEVVRLALPFPAQSGVHFYHDLWLGLIAAATGGVRLIDRPLVDYRQHGGNVMGAVDRQAGWLRGLHRRRPDAMWLRHEAASYGLARYLAHALHSRLSDAVADGDLPPARLRLAGLWPYLRRGGAGLHGFDMARLLLSGQPGLARIAAGFGVVSMGRTIWTLRQTFGSGWQETEEAFDARLYSLSPGMAPPRPRLSAAKREKPQPHDDLVDSRKAPRWQSDFSAPDPALVVLVPTLNPTEIFAGIVTAFDIGLGLAARGFRVRFIATDLPMSSPAASRSFLMRRLSPEAAASGAAGRVSLHCGVQNPTLPAHRGDLFLATAWWSAHIAQRLIAEHDLKQSRFFYLIQDYEPNFYPWGSEFADAMESYGFDFEPIFNTDLLRTYFAAQGFAFADAKALAFHPSIDIARYAAPPRPEREGGPRRLALYGRPEVARNMYPSAIEALAGFVAAEGLGSADIELVSIGLSHAPVDLPGGLQLVSLGKLPWEDYPEYLRSVDLGLSLMYSPHPSHPPIEMAASGVRVVTNGFGPKNLSELSPAIASVPPTAAALTEALRAAWAAAPVAQHERELDLTRLGLSQEAMLDRLAARLGEVFSRDKDDR
ncbi:glycosyl transferase family 1 [Sulfitobacter aestuarii]|uniref:Glycosyl transferase family 1 n=1 Tax=Sulfitobacter aestuarii TaxID=2161676 RepID=A0ABW5U7Q5_9RHOB